MKKFFALVMIFVTTMTVFGCAASGGSYQDQMNTKKTADAIQANQPTPTDIDYSLERYNLIRRAYWVNGQREKAAAP